MTIDQGPPAEAADPADRARIEAIVERGPAGAFAVVGVATAIVVLIWFAFYFLVHLPRGAVQ